MGCSVDFLAPSNFSSVHRGLLLLQVCASCDAGFGDPLEIHGEPAIFLNNQAINFHQLTRSAIRHLECNQFFEGSIILPSNIDENVVSVRATVQFFKNGNTASGNTGTISNSSTPPIFVKIRQSALKRILFLLHVASLWRLMEIKRKLITPDSDVITLVCPPDMSSDEEYAYNVEEETAAEQFKTCAVRSSVCDHPDFGGIMWKRKCSRTRAEALLYSEASYRTPYSFYIHLQDDNLVSLALIFEENYSKPSHRQFMSRFSWGIVNDRLTASAQSTQNSLPPFKHAISSDERSAFRYRQVFQEN